MCTYHMDKDVANIWFSVTMVIKLLLLLLLIVLTLP